jgi:hypothetical protein
MWRPLVIHVLCKCSLLDFLIYEEIFLLLFFQCRLLVLNFNLQQSNGYLRSYLTFLQLVLHIVEPVDEVSDLDARHLPLGLHPLSELPEVVKGCRQGHVGS